eukprot:COSAG01_NODE_98_length_26629_cov_56.866453_28_plen_570_part_01
MSEAVYDAQVAATPAPSESEIAAANDRRAEVRLTEARANQPSLHMGEIEILPDNAGIRVRLTVDAPGRFVVYQNVRVEAGGEFLFQYSECWSVSTSKTQWDYFCIPPHLRSSRYKSVTQMWIERQLPGDDRASYKMGRMSVDNDGGTDPTTPWGSTRGRWALRTVPPNTTPILRQTILRWDCDGVMRQPIEIVPRRSCAIGLDADGNETNVGCQLSKACQDAAARPIHFTSKPLGGSIPRSLAPANHRRPDGTFPNLVWKRVKDAATPEPLLLSPQLAHQWQMLSFEQFLAQVPFKRFSGLDRAEWSACASLYPERQFNMAPRETQVLKLDSPFAQHLRERRADLELPVLPSMQDLPQILKDLQQDDHPMAVEVYIRLSRGVEILPPELAAKIRPSRVPNYKAKTPLLLQQRDPELQRHVNRGFVAYWDDLKRLYPYIGDPHNIHAFGIQPKNDDVCRLTLDATNNGTSEHPSVNEIIDNPPCVLPTMKHMTAAMSMFGNIAVIDDVDAYLQHSVRPSSFKYTCCVDHRTGRMMCFKRLPLGFSVSSAIQQESLGFIIRHPRGTNLSRQL